VPQEHSVWLAASCSGVSGSGFILRRLYSRRRRRSAVAIRRAPGLARPVRATGRPGLDAGHLAAPATAAVLASTALRDLNPWGGQAAANRARAVELAQPLTQSIVPSSGSALAPVGLRAVLTDQTLLRACVRLAVA
jgi:hypothetical protein